MATSVYGAWGAPVEATYLTQTANPVLTNEQALGSLSTGLMKVTTTTGAVTAVTDSAGLEGVVSDKSGSGALVFADTPTLNTPTLNTPTLNTPTLVTPVIGAATGTSVNLTGNVRAASFNVGASAGVDASVIIPAVGTITISKGIVTGFA